MSLSKSRSRSGMQGSTVFRAESKRSGHGTKNGRDPPFTNRGGTGDKWRHSINPDDGIVKSHLFALIETVPKKSIVTRYAAEQPFVTRYDRR
jgi:hypothetical protein